LDPSPSWTFVPLLDVPFLDTFLDTFLDIGD
jgi:hypothetical protein